MKRLYVDMDGTLCRFYEHALCLEKCREPGFFRALQPYENTVKAIRIIMESVAKEKDNICVYILSSVYNIDAKEDKEYWLNRYLGEDIPAYFPDVDMGKAEFVSTLAGDCGLTSDDYLLDDYSKNLLDWSDSGGTAIKFRNELNGRGWNGYNFYGHTVYFDQTPDELAHDILTVMGLADGKKTSPDEPVSEEAMRSEIDSIMNQEPFWQKDEKDWRTELYADYRDQFCFQDLFDIFISLNPHLEFFQKVESMYCDEEYEVRDRISSVVRERLSELGGAYAADEDGFFLSDDTETLYEDLFDTGLFACKYPYAHYYKQKVRLNIMIDTGDGCHDYIENAVYPHWDAVRGAEISDDASIVWLANTQGYSKAELQKALDCYSDELDKTGFLETLGQELINMPAHMAVLTFLIETTLEKALEIADYMCNNNGNAASIRIEKSTLTGLYDPWGGGGSVFGIQLERDVDIPLSIIRTALPDGCDGCCSIEEIYGMAGSAWRDTLISLTAHPSAA